MKKDNNISYKLIERRRINDFLDGLKGKLLNTKDLEKMVMQLAAMGDQVVPVCINKLKTTDPELLGVINLALEMLGDEDIIEPLLKLLTEPNLPDISKTFILNILCYFGYDPSELPLEEMFKDFQGIADASIDKLLNDITRDNNVLPIILEEFGSFPAGYQITLIEELVEKKDKRAVNLISVFAQTGDKEVSIIAVKALGKLHLSEAATALETIASQGDEFIRPLAARELLRLQMSGVRPCSKKPKKIVNEIYKIFISSIDGRGNRIVWLSWRIPNRKTLLISVNLLINTEQGIKDCWGNNRLSVKEFSTLYDDLTKECTLLETREEYVLKLIRDALWKSRQGEGGIPIEFAYWRQFLSEEYLYPEEYRPAIALPSEDQVFGDAALIEKLATLHDEIEFSDWYELNPQVYKLAEEFLSFSSGSTDSNVFSQKLRRFNRNFFNIIIKDNIPELIIRFSLTIEFLEMAGKDQLAKIAKGCLFYMKQIPPEENPFIQRMIYESIKIAINNMKGEDGEGTQKSLS
ncbi:MAG: HEAT repeat domain-containing protein [Thermincolia bacterium]